MDERARLQESIARHAGAGHTRTALPGVSLVCSSTITERLGAVVEPTLSVIAQGVKETELNGRTFTYGPGQFLVVSVELPVVGHVTQASVEEPFLAFVLELRPERIAALLLETAPAATARPSGVEREVLWRLLTGPQGTTVRQVGLADSRLAHVARAIRWIRGHYNETLRVEELAALATMSASSFHRHFRAVTSMTPIQFQKQIRLREARARLLAQPGDITGVGFAVGYDSPSQFSREYRRMFGAPPSRDALTLREAAVLPSI